MGTGISWSTLQTTVSIQRSAHPSVPPPSRITLEVNMVGTFLLTRGHTSACGTFVHQAEVADENKWRSKAQGVGVEQRPASTKWSPSSRGQEPDVRGCEGRGSRRSDGRPGLLPAGLVVRGSMRR
ncbi:hypothetical protein ZWY2020_007035 [Hordeum vulgare]|nr:hypothetical protein ZWY2020_007035 [Hordeum vulgare]